MERHWCHSHCHFSDKSIKSRRFFSAKPFTSIDGHLFELDFCLSIKWMQTFNCNISSWHIWSINHNKSSSRWTSRRRLLKAIHSILTFWNGFHYIKIEKIFKSYKYQLVVTWWKLLIESKSSTWFQLKALFQVACDFRKNYYAICGYLPFWNNNSQFA